MYKINKNECEYFYQCLKDKQWWIDSNKTILTVRAVGEDELINVQNLLSSYNNWRKGTVWGDEGIAAMQNRQRGWGEIKASGLPKMLMNYLSKFA